MSITAVAWAIKLTVGSPSLKATLIAIANYADESGRSWPSQKRLAADTELSARTIRTSLFELEQKGIITRTERVRDDGSRASDMIKLNRQWGETVAGGTETIAGGEEIVSGGTRQELPGEGATVAGLYEPSLEPSVGTVKEKDIRAVAKATRTSFDDFWKLYPKRKGANPRHPAESKFLSLVKSGVDAAEIVGGAARYADEIRADGQEKTPFVAQAIVWLNQRRWIDYPACHVGETAERPNGVWLSEDTPEFDAWERDWLKTKGKRPPRDRNGGWIFPERWPSTQALQA